jgi:tellurite resistance protein TerC
MLAALASIATFDVVFAVDSIPAIFAITRETFLVYAANAFSLLGLSALYFLLAGMMGRFRYLNVGLAAVLVFVGAKMTLADVYEIPVHVSLAVVVGTLAAAVAASWRSSGEAVDQSREDRPGGLEVAAADRRAGLVRPRGLRLLDLRERPPAAVGEVDELRAPMGRVRGVRD